MQYRVKNWEKLSLDDSSWKHAQPIGGGAGNRVGRGAENNAWNLVPSIIPQRELTPQRLLSMRKAEGVSVPSFFPKEKGSISIPENTTASILLDQTFYTNAYPALIFSGGKNSNITITYTEGLYDAKILNWDLQPGVKPRRWKQHGQIVMPGDPVRILNFSEYYLVLKAMLLTLERLK